MDETLEIASKLGAAIANHDRYKMFKEAEEQLKKDSAAKEITEKLEKQSKKIYKLEKNLNPVEVEDKKELQQLKEQAASNQSIQKFLKAQAGITRKNIDAGSVERDESPRTLNAEQTNLQRREAYILSLENPNKKIEKGQAIKKGWMPISCNRVTAAEALFV